MKTLIIPDIHNKIIRAETIICSEDADKVIFLGDFFDAYNDTLEDTELTALWVKKKMEDPKYHFIWGNHDIWYGFPWNKYLSCSGNSTTKANVINKILGREHWDKFQPYLWEQGFFLSHAGLNKRTLNSLNPEFVERDASLEEVEEILSTNWNRDKSNLMVGFDTILFQAGWDRGGRAPSGGLNWGCWSVFRCVPGMKQIVGHTISKNPCVKYLEGNRTLEDRELKIYPPEKADDCAGWAINIDTNLSSYATLENENLKIHKL